MGVIGHSEGGTIAFMLGAEKKADFIISLAGMAISAKETLMKQNSHQLDLLGLEGETKENSLKLISQLFDVIAEQGRNDEYTAIDIDKMASDSNLTVVPAPILASLKQTASKRTPWFDKFLTINPPEYLNSISCPVLAINGDKDKQVDANSNIDTIRDEIPKAKTHIMLGLNHLLQHSTTGEANEYSEIRETISPEVLDLILTFIQGHIDQ